MFENIKAKKIPIGLEFIKRGLLTESQVERVLDYQKDHKDLKFAEIVDILDMCDKIIYLNMPVYTRKIRIFKRFIKQKLGIEKSNYKPTLKMLIQMYKWTEKQENELKEREEQLAKHINKLIKISNAKEWEEYIKNEYSKTKKKQ